MLSSLGQDYSLLDEEPRFSCSRVEHSNPSSSIVQKQKILWSDSTQEDSKKRIEKDRIIYSPYSAQNIPPGSRLIPRKRYIILRPDSQDSPQIPQTKPVIPKSVDSSTKLIRTLSIPTVRRGPITSTARTISRTTIVPGNPRNAQYVLKIPVVRNQFETRPSNQNVIKRTVITQSRLEQPIMTMHIPTVPASMSMGGYLEEEEIDEDDPFWNKDSQLEDNVFLKDCDFFETKPQHHCSELDCFWRGDSEAALKRHKQTSHAKKPVVSEKNLKNVGKPIGKPKGVRCSECEALAYSRPLLLKHMTQIHGIEAPIMHRTFEDREELQDWLEELRTTHAVEFVVSSGSKKWGFGLQVHYLTCSRSGEQKERPNKKFARPPRPSIKCGKNCMAYLKIKQNPITSVLQVEGCLYHSGHMIDGSLIQLTPAEWRKIEAVAEYIERDQIAWDIDRLDLETIREILGHYGRFRLIPDQQLGSLLRQWIKENNQQTFRQTSFFNPICDEKYEPDNFDLLQDNMMFEDSDEYDNNSTASPSD